MPIVTIALLLLGYLSLDSAHAAKPPTVPVNDVDRIVAIVNNDVITVTELERRMADAKKQLITDNIRAPSEPLLRRQLLERLIIEHIQLQIAAQAGIRVSDADIEQAIQLVATRNQLTVDGLYRALARDGLEADEYRNQLRTQMTVQRLIEREIHSRVSVSESEVNSFLLNAKAQAGAEQEFNISHIFIGLPESAATEQIQAAEQLAEKLYREIKAGEDFARVAVAHSHGPDALKGGALGWKKAGQLPALFLEALTTIQPGNITPVLRGPNGFHLLLLNDRRGAGAEPVTQTHVRHILLRPSAIQSLAEATTTLNQLRQRIENGEDFAALARAHSEDTTSASGGGDLGWVSPRQLVPEFEQAMNALAPEALSEPVTTSFGVHLIQVVARRQGNIGEERSRATARNQIHARKSEDRFEQWMRQLRDEAFVEYPPEE